MAEDFAELSTHSPTLYFIIDNLLGPMRQFFLTSVTAAEVRMRAMSASGCSNHL